MSKTKRKGLRGISSLTEEQYCRYVYDMHKALKYDILKIEFRPQILQMKNAKGLSDSSIIHKRSCKTLYGL
jgi:hypothetical protein